MSTLAPRTGGAWARPPQKYDTPAELEAADSGGAFRYNYRSPIWVEAG